MSRPTGRALRWGGALAVAAAALWAAPSPGRAHEVRPGYLELAVDAEGHGHLLMKVPITADGTALDLAPTLPEACEALGEPRLHQTPEARVVRQAITCRTVDLAGAEIGVQGLDRTFTDVLLRVDAGDIALTQVLRPGASSATLPEPGEVPAADGFFLLGVEHIAFGFDHLLFLLALLLLVHDLKTLVATVTAFTVAHSVTLALATLGVVDLEARPIEALIALSIVFVAVEVVHARSGRPGVTARRPYVAAFLFGLLHGFGFASALRDIGLPEEGIPVALLAFNLGVEAGQLAVVLLVTFGALAIRRVSAWSPPRWARLAPAYAIGAIAFYWVLERVVV